MLLVGLLTVQAATAATRSAQLGVSVKVLSSCRVNVAQTLPSPPAGQLPEVKQDCSAGTAASLRTGLVAPDLPPPPATDSRLERPHATRARPSFLRLDVLY